MPESALFELSISEHARMALRSLGDDDRRILSSWFENLRHWNDDELVRSRSRLIEAAEGVYLLDTGADFYVAFQLLEGAAITILSIYRSDAVKKFARAIHTA